MTTGTMTAFRGTPLHAATAPFAQLDVLSAADLHTVHLLTAGLELEPLVALGLCFAVRAPRLGHVGVDLARLPQTVVNEQASFEPERDRQFRALPWPPDLQAWREETMASPLVGAPDAQVATPFVVHGDLLMTRRQWRYQERLAQAVSARCTQPLPPLNDAQLHQDLQALFEAQAGLDRQRLAALMAALLPLTVISGGPGTGKTYTIRKVLALLHRQWLALHGRAPKVALAAPTGKAAVRMLEAMRDGLATDAAFAEPERDWLRQLQPTTLHRLLGFDPRNASRFKHNVQRQLAADVVVVDEASMIDLALMCKLFEATAAGTRLVLLGDRNQLASVEAGSVLADLTAVVAQRGMRLRPAWARKLAEIDAQPGLEAVVDAAAPALADHIVHFDRGRRFREESGIGQAALAITQGRLDDAAAWLCGQAGTRPEPFADIGHSAHGAGQDGAPVLLPAAIEAMAQGFEPYLELLARGPQPSQTVAQHHAEVLKAFEAFRVLAAHRDGPFGVAGLNAAILDALVQRRPGRRAQVARQFAGDDWLGRPLLVTENRYDVGRMNGDVGIVVAVDGVKVAAFLDATGQGVTYLDLARMPPHQTVFAMTVHKSQGSQFRHVVLVLPGRDSALLTRELVYTAVTRAVARLTVVGSEDVLRKGLERQVVRASSLAALLHA